MGGGGEIFQAKEKNAKALRWAVPGLFEEPPGGLCG